MRLQTRRIGQKNEGEGLGDLFGECIVEHKCIGSPFVGRHLVGPLRDRIGLALANPFDRLQPNCRQLLNDRGLLIARAGVRRRRGQVLVGIGALGVGGRQV